MTKTLHSNSAEMVSDNGTRQRYAYEVTANDKGGFTAFGFGCEILDGQAFNQFGEWENDHATFAEAVADGESYLDNVRGEDW